MILLIWRLAWKPSFWANEFRAVDNVPTDWDSDWWKKIDYVIKMNCFSVLLFFSNLKCYWSTCDPEAASPAESLRRVGRCCRFGLPRRPRRRTLTRPAPSPPPRCQAGRTSGGPLLERHKHLWKVKTKNCLSRFYAICTKLRTTDEEGKKRCLKML